MSRAWIWFILSCKRYGKRLSFLLILLILPLAVRGIRTAEESGQTKILVAVYAEGTDSEPADGGHGLSGGGSEPADGGSGLPGTDNEPTDGRNGLPGGGSEPVSGSGAELPPLEQMLAERLVTGRPEEDGSILTFYLCGSEQQVKDEVAARRAECGYVIGQDLREKLDQKKYKRSIRVYSAPSTVAAGLSTEVVFAALMELYDKELFVEYVENGGVFEGQSLAGQAASLYETWLNSGTTFHFTAETLGPETMASEPETMASGSDIMVSEPDDSSKGQDALFPVRGIVAVYVFVIGLYAAVMSQTDEARGLFLPVPYNCRTACRVSSMAAPVFLAAVSGMGALVSGGVMTGLWRELSAMLLYVAAVIAFAWLLRTAVKSPGAICCLIPFFLMGSLLFCPVVIDIGRYVPGLLPVQKLFLPWYYLKLFG